MKTYKTSVFENEILQWIILGNDNKVTIKLNSSKVSNTDNYLTFLTNKQYNIDDVVYFTK